MSTNSLVAILNKDNTVTSSYVHYDGYTTGVGERLLEDYNSEERANDLAWCLGYASSLRETISESHDDRANSDEAVTYESYEAFEEFIRESSYLEYVYVWDTNKDRWMVASWETTRKEVFTGEGRDYEFDSTWNGFENLVTVYVREGRSTVTRYREMVREAKVGDEYLGHASELEGLVDKWHGIGMAEVAREALAA
ncbi:MAG: hypothetical protein QGH26_04170 [Candidatus Pacebacteria bacterium]|jgi:hypothetical protein|nr:hypothetical protein [Candidatus Paceibacterota bacterium]